MSLDDTLAAAVQTAVADAVADVLAGPPAQLAVPTRVAAQMLGVGVDTVRHLVTLGHLDALPDTGSRVVVTVASLHRYAGMPLRPVLTAPPLASAS